MDNKKVLLVDDEEDMIYAVKLQLEANSFEVITAGNGQDVLDKAGTDTPGIII